MVIKRGRPHQSTLQRPQVLSLSSSPEPSRRGLPGNNRYGARGTLKCLNCRNRKARCEFSTEDDDCRWCSQRGLSCGKKLLGEKHQIREHRRLLGIGNTPLSVIAAQLELAYPRRTPWEISEMAREALINAGDGPGSETMSRDGQSLTPHVERLETPEPESPSTPPLTESAQMFLNHGKKTSPRPTQPEQRQSSVPMQLPNYDYATQDSAGRHHYEASHSVYDTSYLTQRIVETGPWSLHQSLIWQESV